MNIDNDPFKELYEEGEPLPPLLSTIPWTMEISDAEQSIQHTNDYISSHSKNLIGSGRKKKPVRSSVAANEPGEVAAHSQSKHRHNVSRC